MGDLGFSFGWVDAHNNRNKKECTPVGCMPPAFLVPGGVCPIPLDATPSGRPLLMEADPPIGRPPSIPVNRQSGVKTLLYPKLRLRAVEMLHHLLKMELLMILEINDSFCDWRFEVWSSSTLLG